MKIFQINGGVFGSTGKIMFGIAQVAKQQGHEVICASPITSTNRNRQPEEQYLKIGTYFGRCMSVLLARVTGFEGCFSPIATWRLLRQIKKYNPDVLHLHSIHNSYLNVPMLFRYIKHSNIPVVWTLHDCWAFTAKCPHFTMEKCEKWKTGCHHCPKYRSYPKTYIDRTKTMWKLKKSWVTGVENMMIVTPSQWLADLVKESFLREYPVKVIHNGIDLEVFKPTPSNFREQYHCANKKVILGVAFGWGKREGLDVFVELAKRLDEHHQIVLVGTDDNVDAQLPENIISIHRTADQQELAQIYTAADLFVNPTREENYPTVNMESIACGTPVLTFRTGGSPEILSTETGCAMDCGDIDTLETEILQWLNRRVDATNRCVRRASAFNYKDRFLEITELYSEFAREKKIC